MGMQAGSEGDQTVSCNERRKGGKRRWTARSEHVQRQFGPQDWQQSQFETEAAGEGEKTTDSL